jgi:hypothetical protein
MEIVGQGEKFGDWQKCYANARVLEEVNGFPKIKIQVGF